MTEIIRSKKTILILLLLLIASQTISLGFAVSRDRPLDQVRAELSGLEYLGPLRQLRELLPLYWNRVDTASRGRDTERESLVLLQEEINGVFHRLEQIDRRHGGRLDTTEDLVQLSKRWQRLREEGHRPEAQADRQRLDDGVLSLNLLVGDASQLMLDPVLETYYLIDSAVNLLVEGGQMLEEVRRIPGAGNDFAGDRDLIILAANLRKHLGETNKAYQIAMDGDDSLRPGLEPPLRIYGLKLAAVVDVLDRLPAAEEAHRHALPELAEAALAANFRLFDRALPEIERLLEERHRNLERKRLLHICSLLPLLAIGLAVSGWSLRPQNFTGSGQPSSFS